MKILDLFGKTISNVFTAILWSAFILFISGIITFFLAIFMKENVVQAIELFKTIFLIV